MKKLKIGINGFGRIGRIAARIILNRPNLTLTAINSRADSSSHAYLLKHDSSYGTLPNKINFTDKSISIDGQKITVFDYPTPGEVPWKKAGVDLVIDSTGKFRVSDSLSGHLKSPVKYAVISTPAKDSIKTLIMGVNEKTFDPKKDTIVSNSSCTTNCLATTLKVLHDEFKVVRGFMTTTHAVTDTQNLLDNSNPEEPRTRRASFASMIPADSGSGREIKKFFPDLIDKIECHAIRIPLLTVSLINLTVEVKNKTTEDEVNKAFEIAAKSNLKGIIDVAKEELVSKDFTGNPYSAIIDPYLTGVMDGNLVNVYAWYDNEWGYASRLVDLVEYIGKKADII